MQGYINLLVDNLKISCMDSFPDATITDACQILDNRLWIIVLLSKYNSVYHHWRMTNIVLWSIVTNVQGNSKSWRPKYFGNTWLLKLQTTSIHSSGSFPMAPFAKQHKSPLVKDSSSLPSNVNWNGTSKNWRPITSHWGVGRTWLPNYSYFGFSTAHLLI